MSGVSDYSRGGSGNGVIEVFASMFLAHLYFNISEVGFCARLRPILPQSLLAIDVHVLTMNFD